MVSWIVNDLSLAGQYATVPAFLADLEALLAARGRLTNAGHWVGCSRLLGNRPTTETTDLAAAARQMTDRTRRSIALGWLANGPFWSSPPEGEGITYFHNEDVTEQGLGEAARRRWLNEDARSFSFKGMPLFEVPSLDVECQRDDAVAEAVVAVPNIWSPVTLTDLAAIATRPLGWAAMIDDATLAFPNLRIARDQIVEEMSRYPFDRGACDRLLGLLKRLNELAGARAEHGDGSPAVTEWLRLNVEGHRADFSSEDPQDPKVFEFLDATGTRIYCPWHGKIHNPLQYRLHYEWPIPAGQRQLKVLFIGEKRTKR